MEEGKLPAFGVIGTATELSERWETWSRDFKYPDSSLPRGDKNYRKATRILDHHFTVKSNPEYKHHVFRQIHFTEGVTMDKLVDHLQHQAMPIW